MKASTRLIAATAAHFDWAMLGPGAAPFANLRLPPGGLDCREVLEWIQRSSSAVAEAMGHPAAWLIVSGDEVVGIISFKGPPCQGAIEIGYGVAKSRRQRGHATDAVALAIAQTAALGLDLVAETASDNRPSQLVLERNKFRRCGERVDREEGTLVLWRRER